MNNEFIQKEITEEIMTAPTLMAITKPKKVTSVSGNLAPINDVNLKIFDEICEERFKKLDLETVLVSIIDNVPASALPHLAEQYHITGNEGWLFYYF